MNIRKLKILVFFLALSLIVNPLKIEAQKSDTKEPNPITTAIPFLRITPDARFGAMGDVGITLSPDANSLYFNASNLVFSEYDFGLSTTYTSWFRSLGINDVFLGYLSAYKDLGPNQTLGFGLRFFSLGQLQHTDEQGNALLSTKPHEMAIDFAYARKLGKRFSLGLTLHYVLSNLGSSMTPNGSALKPAHVFATDLSLTYKQPIKIGKYSSTLTFGTVLSNLGTKASYSQSNYKDYIPANLGIGLGYSFDIDKRNSITLAVDINKLLVPTPIPQYISDDNGNIISNPDFDTNTDGIPDYKQQSMPASLFTSFGDAPSGVGEEFNELNYSFGLEYWYNKQFAVRCGYYHEHASKGNRKFFTMGLGVQYNIFSFNFSYLIPSALGQRGPLDHTLRFSLMFNFRKQKKATPSS